MESVDPSSTALAWLDQTILLGKDVMRVPRRQPFVFPGGIRRIAVVRLETLPDASLDRSQREQTVGLLLNSARLPGIAALQVDFDATRSQREFYASLLGELRARMPVELPLSMTALASWCSSDDWIADLPVDEAVPMMFRMEPDRRRAPADSPWFKIREPLCMQSVGVSTHEPWPDDVAGKRIYIFPDRGWREDLPTLNDRKMP